MLRLDINLLWTVLNLIIWYILIRKFLFKPVNKIIEKREKSINDRYDEAARAEDEARKQQEKYQALEDGIAEEKAQVLKKANEDARVAYQKIVDDANVKADQIMQESKKAAELEREKMVSRAEKEIRSLLLDAATDGLQKNTDNSKIYDQFLTKAGEDTDADE